jgi:hypothetical protein
MRGVFLVTLVDSETPSVEARAEIVTAARPKLFFSSREGDCRELSFYIASAN